MITFLFPGQGSQSKGMGEDLFDEFGEYIKKSDEILGFSIKELCLRDPEGQLNQTQFTQPAMYVVNALSYYKRLETLGRKPDYVAGHSLGEFNALLAAECFSYETGLKLVKKRGELMSQASDGGMAAIIGADKDKIKNILNKSGIKNIEPANYNSPSQIVISGMREEIEKAKGIFQNEGILFIPLKTSGAFHTKYMEPAGQEFERYLESYTFKDLNIPVISNISATPYKQDEIIQNLSLQITNPVKWHESITYLMRFKDMEFEEIGHGKILTGLVKDIQEDHIKVMDEKEKNDQDDKDDVFKQPKEINPKKVEPEEIKRMHVAHSTNDVQELNGQETVVEDKTKHFKNKSMEKYEKNAQEKVKIWNEKYPIGTKVKSKIIDDRELETRTEAMILFGHRAAVYMKGYNGYFDLDEIIPTVKQT